MKIWTITYNDDNGVNTEVFNNEAEQLAAADSWVRDAWDDDEPWPGDWQEAYEQLCEYSIDSIHLDCSNVAPPILTGLDAIIADHVPDQSDGDLEVDSNATISMGEDPGAYVSCWKWVSFAEMQQHMAIIEPDGTVWYFDCFEEFMAAWFEEPNCHWVKGTPELLEKSEGANDAWEYLTREERRSA